MNREGQETHHDEWLHSVGSGKSDSDKWRNCELVHLNCVGDWQSPHKLRSSLNKKAPAKCQGLN